MPLLVKARSFFRNLVSFGQRDSDLSQELQAHLELLVEENLRAGMSRIEAERAARIELGGAEQVKEGVREARVGNWFRSVITDVRFGLRQIRRNPGFATVAVVTLAVAIGANAVAFSAMNGLVLRGLNVPRAESLYIIEHGADKDSSESYPDYVDLRERNRSFEGLAAYNITQAAVDTGSSPSRAWVFEVSGNYFDVLGIQPYLGRLIHSSDDHGPNSAPYVVLTYSYWHTHFQDDRGVVGRVVQLNRRPFTVIGVTPPGFRGTVLIFAPDLFLPLLNLQQEDAANLSSTRGNRWISEAIGHLKTGVSPAQAVADLNSIGAVLERTYPKEDTHLSFSLDRSGLPGGGFASALKAFLGALMLMAGLILVAACANLGSLFAARAADRSREVAVRLALGAGHLRILRQLFTEALLISVTGGAAGLWGSILLLQSLRVWQPFPQYPIHIPVDPDATVYGVALLLSLASGFLFGAVPVKQVLRTDPYQTIKSGPSGSVGRRLTARELLLGVQVAICAVLVISSMVAVRGLMRSLRSNFGFEPQNVMLVSADLSMAGYKADSAPRMQKRMIDATGSIRGVVSVGLVSVPPLEPACCSESDVFADKTADLKPSNAAAHVIKFSVSPEYFQAAGVSLQLGRSITWQDDKHTPRVAVVNRLFATRMFGSATNALGRYYKLDDGVRIQVVGVVEDGKYSPNITEDPRPAMFLPILQSPSNDAWLIVRSNNTSRELAGTIRAKLRDLDAGLPTFVQTWNEAMDGALFPSRMAALCLGVLGIMGAMLSVTGIFGLAAYSVSKRLRELGIRMAVGAQRKDILQTALQRPFKLLALGSVAGLLLGILASRVLAAIVYEATPRDPLVLASAVLAMALVGLVATWIPAQRALSVDPMTLLREQ